MQPSDDYAAEVVRLFEEIHPLDRVARAGYVLRGVAEPESVAAHSHFLALLVMLVCRRHPEQFDEGRAVAMALVHDLCEAKLMDIPMPAADAHLREAKLQAEQAVTEELLLPLGEVGAELAGLQKELAEAESVEACLVRGLDKVQMMLKILMYERDGCTRLSEFWLNPKNFRDHGLEPVSRLFDALCAAAGKPRPV
jgi:putative hydrolase of HD superfamily